MNWTFFATLFQMLDTAFLGEVSVIATRLIAYVQAPLIAGIALYVAGMLMVEMFDPHADTGPKIIRLLTRGAIVYFAVSSYAVFNQYFGSLFLQTLPADITNAISGAVGAPAVNATAFDTLWNTAWAAGEQVFKNIPTWSFKGAFLTLIVWAYWTVAMLAIGVAFLIYLGSQVLVGLLVATGPLFVCLFLWPRTQRMFDAWIGGMAAGVLLQVFTVALLTILIETVGQMVRQIAAASGGAGVNSSNVMTQLQTLAEAAFLFFVCFYLSKEVGAHAAKIADGVGHSVEPYTRAVAGAVGAAGRKIAAPIAGSAVSGIVGGASGRNPRPAGKVIG